MVPFETKTPPDTPRHRPRISIPCLCWHTILDEKVRTFLGPFGNQGVTRGSGRVRSDQGGPTRPVRLEKVEYILSRFLSVVGE